MYLQDTCYLNHLKLESSWGNAKRGYTWSSMILICFRITLQSQNKPVLIWTQLLQEGAITFSSSGLENCNTPNRKQTLQSVFRLRFLFWKFYIREIEALPKPQLVNSGTSYYTTMSLLYCSAISSWSTLTVQLSAGFRPWASLLNTSSLEKCHSCCSEIQFYRTRTPVSAGQNITVAW